MSKMQFNDNNDRIKVIVRIRPKIEREYNHCNQFIRLEENSIIVTTKKDSKQYTFDYIASEDSSQSEIFTQSARDICDSVLQGYNGAIFVYGQTGAGKTHTLLGPKFFLNNAFFTNTRTNADNNNSIHESPIINRGYLTFTQRKEEEGKGILPRSIEYLFAQARELKAADNQLSITFSCSFLEIYQEQISDLLDTNINKQVAIRDLSDSVLIENLTKWNITSPEEAYSLVTKGNNLRHIALTAMNKESSRSHAVFSIYIESKTKTLNGNCKLIKSVFHLIDLAGSERQKATECIGDRLKEAGKINKSLMQLSHVIKSLASTSLQNNNQTSRQKTYIPYRDSKLTHLLKDSLGGNAKTAIIANISPAHSNIQETISTLLFAQSAKMIKNKAVINEEITNISTQSHEELMSLKEKYDLLKSENYYLMNLLDKKGSNITLNPSEFSKTIDCVEDEIEKMIAEIADKDKQIEFLSTENEEIKEHIQKIYIELRIKEKELKDKKNVIQIAKSEYDSVKDKLKGFALSNAYNTEALKSITNEVCDNTIEHRNAITLLTEAIKENNLLLSSKELCLSNEKEHLYRIKQSFDLEKKIKQQQSQQLSELNRVQFEKESKHQDNTEYIDTLHKEVLDIKSIIDDKQTLLNQRDKTIESVISKRNEIITEKKGYMNILNLSLLDKEEQLRIINREKGEIKQKIDTLTQDKESLLKAIKENNEQRLQMTQSKDTLINDISCIQLSQQESKNKNTVLCERLNQLTEYKNANCNKTSLLSKIKNENKKLNEEYYSLNKSYSTLHSGLTHLFGNNNSMSSQMNLLDLVNQKKRELNEANNLLTSLTKRIKGVMNEENETILILTSTQEEVFSYYFDVFIKLHQSKTQQRKTYRDTILLKNKSIAGMQREMINKNVLMTSNKKRCSTIYPLETKTDEIAQSLFKRHKRKFCDYISFDPKEINK